MEGNLNNSVMNKLYILFFLVLFMGCKKQLIEASISKQDLLYNSYKFDGEQYEVTLETSILFINHKGIMIDLKKESFDTLLFKTNNHTYYLHLNEPSGEWLINPNDSIITTYQSDFISLSDTKHNDSLMNLVEKGKVYLADDKQEIPKNNQYEIIEWVKLYLKDTINEVENPIIIIGD